MYNDSNYIILSIIFHKNHIGVAYYNLYQSKLQILEDIFEEKTNFDIINCVYKQIMPQKIITITGQSNKFYSHLKKIIEASQIDNHNSSVDNLVILSKSEYCYFSCFNRVRSLKLDGEPKNANQTERIIFLNSFLNFASYCIINALGLLLLYIDKYWNSVFLCQMIPIQYSSLNYFNLNEYVSINEEFYTTLNIMNPKINNYYIKSNNAVNDANKMDLFSLFNYCKTRLGEQYLRKMFKHPTKNIIILNERYDFVKYCMDPVHNLIVCNLKKLLSEMYNIPKKFLTQCCTIQKKFKEWKLLYKILKVMNQITEQCEIEKNGPNIFKKITNCITEKIIFLKFLIEYVLNFQNSNIENFFVKNGVDSVLDKLTSICHCLPQILSTISSHKLKSLPSEIENYHLVYIPEVGYAIAVTKWKILVSNYRNIPNIEYKFSANGVNYYKSSLTAELDQVFGDICQKIRKRSSRIILKLEDYINYFSDTIIDAIQICAELDALLALYDVAHNQHYVRPQIVSEHKICIYGGRHPLIEQTTTFIPNDIIFGDHKDLIKIITGPNNSGKSTFIKQTALIIFMAHIGSYVPANTAVIGIISQIFSKITTCESISLESSSFLQDIRQINRALSSANKETLIIIDEFGKSTSEIDATALLAAIINEFVNRGTECPYLLVITYFYKIFDWIPNSNLVSLQTFEFSVEKNNILFLYRLVKGRTSCSYSLSVTQLINIDEYILNNAKMNMKMITSVKPLYTPLFFSYAYFQNKTDLVDFELIH